MKYMIQGDIDPVAGIELEAHPERVHAAVGQLQALDPIGLFFHATRRGFTAIVDVPSEEALLEPLHGIWAAISSYPTVTPVVDADDFARLLQRVGVLPEGTAP
jgi:hypothetical protein